jgi:DNA repair protein RecO (recombination protein O)
VDFGESDRIITLMTEERGKIGALARGARKSCKRFGGALESFTLLEATFGHRKGQLWPLKEATLLEAYPGLAADLSRVQICSLVLELVREMTLEQQPSRSLFSFVRDLLPAVAAFDVSKLEWIAIAAVLKVLDLSGMAVAADHCNACGKKAPRGKKVLFNPSRGGVVCTPCGGGPVTLSSRAAAALADLSKLPLESLAEMDPDPKTAGEIKTVLSSFWEFHLDRPLRAQWFFSHS